MVFLAISIQTKHVKNFLIKHKSYSDDNFEFLLSICKSIYDKLLGFISIPTSNLYNHNVTLKSQINVDEAQQIQST